MADICLNPHKKNINLKVNRPLNQVKVTRHLSKREAMIRPPQPHTLTGSRSDWWSERNNEDRDNSNLAYDDYSNCEVCLRDDQHIS